MREKLFEVVKLLHDSLEPHEALEYVEIFLKYLAHKATSVTKTDAAMAVDNFFKGRGADMVRGWAKEYVDEARLFEAREMVLDALGFKFSSNVPQDICERVKTLDNRNLLKKIHKSVIQSNDLDSFRQSMRELAVE